MAYDLKFSSININGMNDLSKQRKLVNHIKVKKLDVIFLQEHNLRNKSLLSTELLNLCDVHINLTINQKGGTAILINKRIGHEILSCEMSADSRIISIRVKYYGNILQFVNVYAPANVSHSERDLFFQEELLYYLRNNINNVNLGGD